MKSITLNYFTGVVALVSDHRYEYLRKWKWHLHEAKPGKFYAVRYSFRKRIMMHRVITNAPNDFFVDHRDGDGLNNQDENLRLCTNAENIRNQKKHKNNTTGYRGVFRLRDHFTSAIMVDGEKIYLGFFKTAILAAKAYDRAAHEYFGEFAVLNFP